jgi:hypothetical protein
MFLTALGIILIIIAVCLWLLCPIRISQLKRRTAETEGYAAKPEQSQSRNFRAAWSVNYSYIVNGTPQTFKAFKLHVPSANKVTICYNPMNPRDGHVKEFRTLNPQVYVTIGGILAYAGVVLAVVGAI